MYALCVSGAVNTQGSVWKFFYAFCVHFHSFRSKADDEFCFVVRLAVSKHRGQPNLQWAVGSSQSLPQSAGPRVRDERSPCLSAMATSMPSFPKDTPKTRHLQRWKKHNLRLQSCVIHDGSKFPAWTFFFSFLELVLTAVSTKEEETLTLTLKAGHRSDLGCEHLSG